MENNTGYALGFFGKHIEPTEEQKSAAEQQEYIAKVIGEAITELSEEILVRLKTEISDMTLKDLMDISTDLMGLSSAAALMAIFNGSRMPENTIAHFGDKITDGPLKADETKAGSLANPIGEKAWYLYPFNQEIIEKAREMMKEYPDVRLD